nr:retrotransposon Orf1 [Tanacetum cinerariifolium]
MRDENSICTIGDYSKPSHEGYRNTIKLLIGNNVVQRLMEAHLALTQPTQVSKIITLYEICKGPRDTQYCMENPEQTFIDYVSSPTDKAGGLVFEFMASQDATLSRFEADFKQQQSKMTNKIDIMLKAITDKIAGTMPSDTVKIPKLGATPVLSARSYPTEDLSIIDPRLSQVVLVRPFIEVSNVTHYLPEGVVRFINENNEVAYKMPHKIEQYNSLPNLEKEHTKSVYLRNEEDKRRGVDYVMSKILGFYKECLELGFEYVTGLDDEGEVT